MLIRFETPAYATITMFGDVAVALIRLMGHSGSVPSALLAADVAAARQRLDAAVHAHPDTPLDPATSGDARARDDAERVSLAHRALPLLELLAAAERDRENVMWDSGGA